MQELEKIIEKRAIDKARKEVQILIDTIHGNGNILELFDSIEVKILNVNIKLNMRNAFWGISSEGSAYLVEKLTKKYIPEQAKELVERLDYLQDQIDDLKDSTYKKII